jgi:hypothetical protein
MMLKPTGWRYESHRHKLAAQGISTKRYKPGRFATVRGTQIIVKPHPAGEAYPVTPEDVKRKLEELPAEDTKGLKAVEFVKPNEGEQRNAWAQQIRSKRKMLIFSQKVRGNKIGGEDAVKVRQHMLGYVIPHEVGHFVALNKRNITDRRLATAEARADAYAARMDVEDSDIRRFEKYH